MSGYGDKPIRRRCARVGCSNLFWPKGSGKTAKKFCSRTCCSAELWYRKRGTHARRGKRTNNKGGSLIGMTCRNGHERTRENTSTYFNKKTGRKQLVCQTCQREANARYRAKGMSPERRERRRLYAAQYRAEARAAA